LIDSPPGRSFATRLNPWVILSGAVTLFVLLPIAALIAVAWQGSSGLWAHLFAFVLPIALRDTAVLLTGVGVLSGVLGAGAAWIVTFYDFRGRSLVSWALLLPLAVPTYIIAYAYLDILHPVGPLQNALRALLGFEGPREFRLPDIRSMPACIVLLSFVLYPYVYLPTRAMFLMQAANLIDAARTLGVSRASMLFRVGLPLARPAVAVGLSLALMEALNDVGASEFLGVRTLTVSIYSTWVTRSDLAGAAQIALAMLFVVVALVLLERWARRQRQYAHDALHPRPLVAHRLRGVSAVAALAMTLVPVTIGFLVPAVYLIHATIARVRFAGVSPNIVNEAINTFWVSVLATISMIVCAVVVVYAVRLGRGQLAAVLSRLSTIGYAVPGTVLALGLLPVTSMMDSVVDAISRALTGQTVGLLMISSGAAVIYAYAARFLAVTVGGVEAGFSRISPSLDDAARTLGKSASGVLWHVHVPIARPALATAGLLALVDCMKELPATLLLRPIGFETLATHLYGEAARGTYEDAALAALAIVAIGIVPVILLARVGQSIR
jgi:iron(III) transport system permease protein